MPTYKYHFDPIPLYYKVVELEATIPNSTRPSKVPSLKLETDSHTRPQVGELTQPT